MTALQRICIIFDMSGEHLYKRQFVDESSDSEDEVVQARIGDVPHQWYQKEEHFGYTEDGKPLAKKNNSGKIMVPTYILWRVFQNI